MKLSASKAAKAAGTSIPTITRHIKSGRLSAEKVEGGGYLIDPAELFRVFPQGGPVTDETPTALGPETPSFTGALEVEIKMLREMLAELRGDRDHWRELAERTTLLLTAPAPEAVTVEDVRPAPADRPAWWRRLVANAR